jgi:hypothetical protein
MSALILTMAAFAGFACSSEPSSTTATGVESASNTSLASSQPSVPTSYPRPYYHRLSTVKGYGPDWPFLAPYQASGFLAWDQRSYEVRSLGGWSVSLDGCLVRDSSTSPDTSRALILASPPGVSSLCRVLLIDTVPGGGAKAILLREIDTLADSAVEIRLARDGGQAALMLDPGDISTGQPGGRVEILDDTGATTRSFLTPEKTALYSWAVDDNLKTVALSTFRPFLPDWDHLPEQVRVFRESELVRTIDLLSPGWVDLSPDGESLVVLTQGLTPADSCTVAAYATDGDGSPTWSVQVPGGVTYVGYVGDGKLLLVEKGEFDSSGREVDPKMGSQPLLFLRPSDGCTVWSASTRWPHTGMMATSRFGHLFGFLGASDGRYIILDVSGPTPSVHDGGGNYSMLTYSYDGTAGHVVGDTVQIEGAPLWPPGAPSDASRYP